KLVGKACGEVDPKNSLNRIIVNLGKAPRNRRGRVEYASDICILKPLDMARGNGFLMRQGYTIVWCGWQGDLMPLKNWLVLKVPAATHGSKPILARIRTEIVVDEQGVKSQPLSGDARVKSYEAAAFDKTQATLTVREKSYGERIAVAPGQWEFAVSEADGRGGEIVKPSAEHLYLHGGFEPGHI